MFGSILVTSSLSGWTHDTKIGDIFLSMMSFFKSYTGFSNNFENALNTISKCKKQPTFQLYLKHCVDTIPGCGKLWLEDHLITPIQRIPRLIMLLKDLIKRTGTCMRVSRCTPVYQDSCLEMMLTGCFNSALSSECSFVTPCFPFMRYNPCA